MLLLSIIHNISQLFLQISPRSVKFIYSMSSSSSSVKFIAEYAKSNRSSCKKCSKKIDAGALRFGMTAKNPRLGFETTKWHHLQCFPLKSNSISSADSIEGFSELKNGDQEALKKLVSEGDQSSEKANEDAETELEERDSRKRKANEDAETEPERRKASDAPDDGDELVIFFSSSDIKDKYKEAILPPKWKAFETIIFLEQDDGLKDSKRIAAFDFDGCLAKTSVKRTGADAWSLMYPSIPEKLQSLYNDGYKLVVFTNESNIDRWKNKRQVAVDSKIGRLDSFIKLVKVPVQVFIACGANSAKQEDPFRKPKPGMWRIMEQQFNSGIPVDLDQSFYVGDAAGRKDDHSDADIKFAQAIGLKFFVPEEYFPM